jgi:Co/Zn/Cd efflux system component
MLAERAKERDGITSIRSKLCIEILIPLFAILTLLIVTLFSTLEALEVLKSKAPDEDSVNVAYLYTFASINLVVDIVCVLMFYFRGKEVFIERQNTLLPQLSLDTSIHSDDEFGELGDYSFRGGNGRTLLGDKKLVEGGGHDQITGQKRNLNMISAFAHIGGDSLRTISVLSAAIASTVTGASVDLCDAWGALVVSGVILVFMLPLCYDIFRAFLRLYGESQQEYSPVGEEDLDEVVI